MMFGENDGQMGQLLAALTGSPLYGEANLHDLAINSGAYVFYEGRRAMYVGIVGRCSKQDIRTRVNQHRRGVPKTAPLASLMTIAELRLGRLTRSQLAADYCRQFRQQQERVRNMEVQAVEIMCCVTLAAFEIYAAVQLQTPYNDFCTH